MDNVGRGQESLQQNMKSSWAYLMKIRGASPADGRHILSGYSGLRLLRKELEDRKNGVGFCRDCGAGWKTAAPGRGDGSGVLLYACYLYGGSVRRIVHRYKFDSGKWLAPF